ncbi:phosphatidylserine/phosphatidylglycerophosphate/cardiolipin synthase family protein [Patescibacteria group bacterium]|nr:phosphatidylserine/phosphatidylglycerophosphate/cardiolipin synthase family protein [Patescibacteria group bacterium]
MKYKFYNTSEKAWQAMYESIQESKVFILLEMYIFLPDTSPKYDFIETLIKKAESGVKVAIIADKIGSQKMPTFVIKKLRKAGIEFLFASKLLRRTHRKILVVDNHTAFLGGVNIKRSTSKWNDLQIKITGKKSIKSISRTFAYSYKMYGGKKKEILDLYNKSKLTKVKNIILEHNPHENISTISTYYREKIIKAKETITIVTPYLLPPLWLAVLLDKAVRRGVKVNMLIPKKTDLWLINFINNSFVKKMSSLGIDIYYYGSMNHAKLMLIDDKELFMGSHNMDIASFKLNSEIGIFIQDKKAILEVKEIILKWQKDSIKIEAEKYKLNWFDFILMRFIAMFYSIL